ncbi:hypothetical protein M405DRAFT_817570 [Rhizopogon salebrosus TDB-379]|nr:hypothetical protein M405DRAFT_817570 [Rhizopogon salebrosus TDB-379]
MHAAQGDMVYVGFCYSASPPPLSSCLSSSTSILIFIVWAHANVHHTTRRTSRADD